MNENLKKLLELIESCSPSGVNGERVAELKELAAKVKEEDGEEEE